METKWGFESFNWVFKEERLRTGMVVELGEEFSKKLSNWVDWLKAHSVSDSILSL